MSFILSCGISGIIKIWSVQTGECVHAFHTHTSYVFSVSFNHDRKIKIWSLKTIYNGDEIGVDAECIHTLLSNTSDTKSLSFSHPEICSYI